MISSSAKTICEIINASEDGIMFTSGGTESDNMAVFGACYNYQRRGKHIMTTKTEHPAVGNCFAQLASEGFDVTYIPVDKNGYVDLDFISNNVRSDTIFISIILINNETGTIQPMEDRKSVG